MGLCIFKRHVQHFPCLNLLKPTWLCCCMPAKALSSSAFNCFMNNLPKSALNYATSLLVLPWVVAWASCSWTPLASTSWSSPAGKWGMGRDVGLCEGHPATALDAPELSGESLVSPLHLEGKQKCCTSNLSAFPLFVTLEWGKSHPL